MSGFSWEGGTKRFESQKQSREEKRIAEQWGKHIEKQAWNPNGCEPEPDFPGDER